MAWNSQYKLQYTETSNPPVKPPETKTSSPWGNQNTQKKKPYAYQPQSKSPTPTTTTTTVTTTTATPTTTSAPNSTSPFILFTIGYGGIKDSRIFIRNIQPPRTLR
eukprot:TRINITY_DN2259_c0_g1_i2.p2 TRINITY_DN2259_c0_g1~~TRINITY_DN2259_c0_g1_i2.p2  ORF type:complete len:106 (-),score=15.83 TRINITY_DN2259_c0_g1_i2:5-322(-)